MHLRMFRSLRGAVTNGCARAWFRRGRRLGGNGRPLSSGPALSSVSAMIASCFPRKFFSRRSGSIARFFAVRKSHAAGFPGTPPRGQVFKRADHRLLHHVLRKLEVPRAVDSRQDGHDLSGLMAEKVCREMECGWLWIVGRLHGNGGGFRLMTNGGAFHGHRLSRAQDFWVNFKSDVLGRKSRSSCP